jgi:hypothetical protein
MSAEALPGGRTADFSMSNTAPFERFPYPRQLVVGVFRHEEDLQRALEALERAGFEPERREVLHGEQDARSLDVSGEAHGFRGHVMRLLQAASSEDLDHVRRHAEHLRAGHYVLAVAVGDDEQAKQRAAGAMRDSRGEFLNYYADNYIESLDVR